MFDELSMEGLGIASVLCLILAVFLFRDPVGVGMSDLPLLVRVMILVFAFPMAYFITARMID